MSAQVSEGLRSLRGSVGSSTAEAVSLHSSLREALASFDLPASTTIRQLYDLLSKLDNECLQHATDPALDPAQDSTSEVESVGNLALFLSGSLSQCGYPGTAQFQEIQLRALVSSLALLLHNKVHSLDPKLFDNLRISNIAARFQNIAFQVQRESTLVDRIRHAPNVYLIQLASQYVLFFNRGNSPWPSIFEPIMNIFFSALSVVSMVLDSLSNCRQSNSRFRVEANTTTYGKLLAASINLSVYGKDRQLNIKHCMVCKSIPGWRPVVAESLLLRASLLNYEPLPPPL